MANTSFLAGFIEEMLSASGFSHLSDEQKAYYIPQMTALLEERIGLELLPKLSDAQMEEFAQLAAGGKATAEEWKMFWGKNIPNFEEEMKRILTAFAKEAGAGLTK
jgi:hypothetical protein